MTEKTEKKPAKGKRATVWNTGDRPLALPDGTLLPVAPEGEEEDDEGTVVQDWAAFEENATVQEWLESGLLEVGEAPPEEEKQDKPKPKQQEKDKQKQQQQEREREPQSAPGQPPKPKV